MRKWGDIESFSEMTTLLITASMAFGLATAAASWQLPADSRMAMSQGKMPKMQAVKSASSVDNVFFEDFESIADIVSTTSNVKDILPNMGWTVVPESETDLKTFEAYTLDGLSGHSGLYYMYSPYNYYKDRNEWAISPPIRLEKGKRYSVSTWGSIPGYRYVADEFRVAIGKEPNKDAMSTVVIDKSGSNAVMTSLGWEQFTGEFVSDSDGDFYVGFNHCSPKDGDYVAFDDVRVREIPANGAEIRLLQEPWCRFLVVPSFWNVPQTINMSYLVENIGSAKYKGYKTVVTDSSDNLSDVYAIDELNYMDTDTFECSRQFSPIKEATQRNFNIDVELMGEKIVGMETGGFEPTRLSDEGLILADNGKIGSYVSLSELFGELSSAKMGVLMDVPVSTTIRAVDFCLVGDFSTATSTKARIFKVGKTSVTEFAVSATFDISHKSGLEEYRISFPNGVDVAPGRYIISLDENKNEKLGLGIATNFSGKNFAFTDEAEWSVNDLTPAIRIRVTDPSAGIDDSFVQNVTVRVNRNGIDITGASGSDRVAIADIAGRVIYCGEIVNHISLDLQRGFYFVVIGKRSFKGYVK